MSKQIREQIQVRLKMLDDVFHNAIISLERLESYLVNEDLKSSLSITAINSERDKHDDESNPPTKKMLYAELQLQCSALYFQTKFDDIELFEKTVKYFLEDLISWYGGRDENIPFDDVDKFFLPLVSSLSRNITSVTEIMQTVKEFVCDIDNDIKQFNDEEKEEAVLNGFKAFIRAQESVEQSNKKFIDDGNEVVLTIHKRGDLIKGFERLKNAFIHLYDSSVPLQFFLNTINKYLTHIEFNQEDIIKTFNNIKTKNNE